MFVAPSPSPSLFYSLSSFSRVGFCGFWVFVGLVLFPFSFFCLSGVVVKPTGAGWESLPVGRSWQYIQISQKRGVVCYYYSHATVGACL